MYGARSKAVHGKEIGTVRMRGTDVPMSDIVAKIEEYSRKSIRTFLQLGTKYQTDKQILEAIDESILCPENRTTLRAT
jgi:hypothetical protein